VYTTVISDSGGIQGLLPIIIERINIISRINIFKGLRTLVFGRQCLERRSPRRLTKWLNASDL
jgi:hypothetical protein